MQFCFTSLMSHLVFYYFVGVSLLCFYVEHQYSILCAGGDLIQFL